MSARRIKPFLRSGAWTTDHDTYYQTALKMLDELDRKEQALQIVEDDLKSQGEESDYIFYATDEDRKNLFTLSVTVQLFCCMSVEAFLNFYGVVRLSEEVYKRVYERLSATQKLETLIADCQQITLPKDAEITKLVQQIFRRRNTLVHPKTKEVKSPEVTSVTDFMALAKQQVLDMQQFYRLFQNYDSETTLLLSNLLGTHSDL